MPGLTGIDPVYDVNRILPDRADESESIGYDIKIEEHPLVRLKRKY